MDKSIMLTVSAAPGFCIGGISIAHAETSEAGRYTWPHYPQQCLIKADVAGVADATVRVAVANPPGESGTTNEPARPVDPRFDDRNYF